MRMASASPGETYIVKEIHSLFNANKADHDVLESLTRAQRELSHLMRSTELRDETCGYLVHLIARSVNCERSSMQQKVLNLLNFFCYSSISDKKGADLLLRRHSSKHHEYHCILTDYISVIAKLNLIMPASMVSTQKIGLVTLLQKQVEATELLIRDTGIQSIINDLHNNLMVKMAEKAKTKKDDRMKRELLEDNWKPQENFRQLPVLPVENDLIYDTPFLRSNKMFGRYNNLDHYLDVQFRLYKEDCICPLREAYKEFIRKDKDGNNFRLDSGRIYRDVKILKDTSTSAEHGEVFIVNISSDHRKRIKWNNSRRLTFGALLIVSFDRFYSTFFAVVTDSDHERLQNEGLFEVKIHRTRQNQQIPRETPGIILEATSAYFEAYYHVLLALQSIRDYMPFEQYIVKCNTQIDLPRYLAKDPEVLYDLTPTIENTVIWENGVNSSEPYYVEVADTQSWPTREWLNMDESQRKAFISALTKEFVLIQGPPGTGKTFLGLQIAKALLHNLKALSVVDDEEELEVKKPCLLVVCYTNHALDQFVEGIINFLPEDKRNVVHGNIPEVIRIGSRCKNEVVEKYNIKHVRRLLKDKDAQWTVLEHADEARHDILSLRAALKAIQSRRIVVGFNNIKQVMTKNHARMFSVDVWLDWLHASKKSWAEESQKIKSNSHENTKQEKKVDDDMNDTIVETDNEVNETPFDDHTRLQFDKNLLRVSKDKQLAEMLKVLPGATYQGSLTEKTNQTNEPKEETTTDEEMINRLYKQKSKKQEIKEDDDINDKTVETENEVNETSLDDHTTLQVGEDLLEDSIDILKVLPDAIYEERPTERTNQTQPEPKEETMAEEQMIQNLNRHENTKEEKKKDDDINDTIFETDYEINNRSLDDHTTLEVNESLLGVNIDKQLAEMLKALPDATYQERVTEIANQTQAELKEETMADEQMIKILKDKSTINLKDRWKMYRYWLHQYINLLQNELQRMETYFNKIFDDYKKAKAELDEVILSETTVIAVTTTTAAKYHDSLMKLGPKITIIEEAAEVPEAHIVTAINPDCEHLILIGDHKQLEPKPAVHKLAVKYNLSISLFERMLKNGLHFNCLERQHRMRPEISNLVRHMYPVLEDNSNVLDYENIGGISHNLFFVSHEYPEQFKEDGKSFSNEHEADYTKQLCNYLLKQGYHASEITIIAAYSGQMFLLRSKMPRKHFEGVNIYVLDNYQGEENEIIILSLVRSNESGNIGFLKKENRTCVALSRAKKGLYILGNSKTLEIKTAEWRTVIGKIRSTSIDGEEVCLLGNSLPLYCQNHPKTTIMAKMPSDFEKAPEGGCDRKCEQRLKCGHVCRLFCHPYDKDHEEYECRNTCYKRCPGDHVCSKSCHYPEPCDCSVMMDRTLTCGHSAKLACYIDPNEYKCQIRVRSRCYPSMPH